MLKMSMAVPMPSNTDSKMRLRAGTFQRSRSLVPGVEVLLCPVVAVVRLGLVRLLSRSGPTNSLDGVRKVGGTGLLLELSGGNGGKLCKGSVSSIGPDGRKGCKTVETETAVAGPVRLGVSDELPCCP